MSLYSDLLWGWVALLYAGDGLHGFEKNAIFLEHPVCILYHTFLAAVTFKIFSSLHQVLPNLLHLLSIQWRYKILWNSKVEISIYHYLLPCSRQRRPLFMKKKVFTFFGSIRCLKFLFGPIDHILGHRSFDFFLDP